jgi:hypothetical protein
MTETESPPKHRNPSEYLADAQDRIEEAAQRIGEVINGATSGSLFGTRRMDFLTQCLSQLNSAWALAQAANGDYAMPSVRQTPARQICRLYLDGRRHLSFITGKPKIIVDKQSAVA